MVADEPGEAPPPAAAQAAVAGATAPSTVSPRLSTPPPPPRSSLTAMTARSTAASPSPSPPPCGAAFLRLLHTDPSATHVSLPTVLAVLPSAELGTAKQARPGPPSSAATTAAGSPITTTPNDHIVDPVSQTSPAPATPISSTAWRSPSAECESHASPQPPLPPHPLPPAPPVPASQPAAPPQSSSSPASNPLVSPDSAQLPQPLTPHSAQPHSAPQPASDNPVSPRSQVREPLSQNMPVGDRPQPSGGAKDGDASPTERVDTASAFSLSPTGDRSASFGGGCGEVHHELNAELPPHGRRTSWNDFAIAYCNGRFDPARIPNPPRFDRPSAAASRATTAVPTPPTPLDKAPAGAPRSSTATRPSGGGETAAPLSASRPKSFELEGLPSPRSPPSKISLPQYNVAAATVRLASSNLPDSMFAPLSVPSPERELLDPLASVITSPSASGKGLSAIPSSSNFVWNRSKSSVLPSGTPTHNNLSCIQRTPVPTPVAAATSPVVTGPATLACYGSGFMAADPPAAQVPGSSPDTVPPVAPVPDGQEPSAEDYFGTAPATSEIEEPADPIPVPDTFDYPLVHHPHELRPFFEKYGFLPAPMPPREADRRKALYNFNILHTAADINFDRIVHMVKLVFNTRIVFLSLIDSDQQWYKSQTGFGGTYSPRVTGFCGHCLLVDSDEPFVVLDTLKDWRFANNPHVTGTPHVRFYAGTPLRTADGLNLGSLCLVDDRPRSEFTPRSRHILKEFAAIVMREMELWRDKLQLRTRDKIQTSMEQFTRECLEIDDKLSSTNFEAASRMGQVYRRAAKLVHQTLDLDGCTILDISQFERAEVDLPDGTQKVVYHANPYHESQSVLERFQSFGSVSQFPVLASTPDEVQTRDLTPLEHERMSIFLGDQRDGRIFENIAPSWIRYIFPPSLKYGMVVPVIGIDGQPFALICAHTHDRGKQFLEGYELQFLRAIGVIILSAVLRRRMILADRSKSVLISSVSHELRTPLHGILAATELLSDSPLDTNQAAFLATVKTCGQQLIETVNHVLDFTKLSSEKSNGGRRRTANLVKVDLADIVEQTVESCYVGQQSRYMQLNDTQFGNFYSPVPMGMLPYDQRINLRNQQLSSLESVVDIGLRPTGWKVMVDTGSLRRIVMNLYGNSLKFTQRGFVQVSLRELPHEPGATRIPVELTVVDTGKGIGKSFLKDQLFQPFTQENPLQPGTGLGLAIVNSIVRSDTVQGNVDVWSAEGVGTEIKVSFEVELADDVEDHANVPEYHLGEGYNVCFLGFDLQHRGLALVREVIASYATFMGFTVVSDVADADLLIVNEFVKHSTAENYRDKALILVATFKKSDPQTLSAMGRIAYTGLVYKPVGPSKVMKELRATVRWLKAPSRVNSGLSALDAGLPHTDSESLDLRPRVSREVSGESIGPSASQEDLTTKMRHMDMGPRRRSDEMSVTKTHTRPVLGPRGTTYHSVPAVPASLDTPPITGPTSPTSVASGLSTISLADGGAMLRTAAHPELSGLPRRPARVMVVEDNVINRRVLTAFLKKRGFQHTEAVNGADGVELFDKTPPNYWDVLLMDITMPVMNGYDATRSIRRIEAARRKAVEEIAENAIGDDEAIAAQAQLTIGNPVKIFALTGLATDSDKRQAFDSGVDGYLVKPVSLASLDLLFTKIGF